MARGLSLYLDLIRFLAAMLVLLSHFAYPRFSRGDYMIIRDYNLGSDAVVLFFVLSGFVIAFCAAEKDRTLKSFAFNRATRIYSVAIPALILTFVFDRIGAFYAPKNYDGWFYNAMPFWEHMLRGITFTNEWDWFVARIGTNGPYWSLSYEVGYYILFGIAVYLSGARRIALLVAAVLMFGLKIMLLMPAWLLGVWAYHVLKRKSDAPENPTRWWIIAALMWVIYIQAQAVEAPEYMLYFTILAIGAEWESWLRFSDEFIWNGFIGVLFAVHIIAMGKALASTAGNWPAARSIRWLAGGSFSIYVLHYPLMQMIDETMTNDMHPLLHDVLLLGLVTGGCLLFAQIFERTLPQQRRWLASLSRAKPTVTPAE